MGTEREDPKIKIKSRSESKISRIERKQDQAHRSLLLGEASS